MDIFHFEHTHTANLLTSEIAIDQFDKEEGDVIYKLNNFTAF